MFNLQEIYFFTILFFFTFSFYSYIIYVFFFIYGANFSFILYCPFICDKELSVDGPYWPFYLKLSNTRLWRSGSWAPALTLSALDFSRSSILSLHRHRTFFSFAWILSEWLFAHFVWRKEIIVHWFHLKACIRSFGFQPMTHRGPLLDACCLWLQNITVNFSDLLIPSSSATLSSQALGDCLPRAVTASLFCGHYVFWWISLLPLYHDVLGVVHFSTLFFTEALEKSLQACSHYKLGASDHSICKFIIKI